MLRDINYIDTAFSSAFAFAVCVGGVWNCELFVRAHLFCATRQSLAVMLVRPIKV